MEKYNMLKSIFAWVCVAIAGVVAVFGVVGLTINNTEQVSVVTETEAIPYGVLYIEDNTLEYGKTAVRSQGSTGTRTLTYQITTKGGKELSRELIKSEVTTKPVDRVIAKGTKMVWRCRDVTSFDRNPYNDNYCEYSDGTARYVADSEARVLDPTYRPGKSGAAYYNNF